MSKHIKKFLSAYLDGELDEKNKSLVLEHLKECRECTEELNILKTIDQMARSSGVDEPEEDYWKTLPGRIRSRIILEGEKGRLSWIKNLLVESSAKLKFASTFAVVILVLLVGRHFLLDQRSMTISSKGERNIRLEEPSPTPKDELKTEKPPDEPKPSLNYPEGVSKTTPPSPSETGAEKPALEREEEVSFSGLDDKEIGMKDTDKRKKEELMDMREESLESSKLAVPSVPPSSEGLISSESAPEGVEEMEVSLNQRKVSRSDMVQYEIALSHQTRGEYGDAIKNYTQVIEENEILAPSAQFQINLIQSALKDTVSEEVKLKRNIEIWRSFVKNYRESELIPEAYRNMADNSYLLSQLTQKDEDIHQAIDATQKYLEVQKGTRTAELYLRQKMELEKELKRRRG